MDGNVITLCDNLIKWLQTLGLTSKHGNLSELSDGVAIAEALMQIAPEFFTPAWNSKIKTDGTNWRLKVSNLKKILEGVVDYHQDVLNLSLQEFARPNVGNIAENHDPYHLGRLLQLVLSCAVNCNQKQKYIAKIMELELSCQQSIMQAIQELETMTLGPCRTSLQLDTPDREQSDTEIKEALAQRCHELDSKVKELQEEKMMLQGEVARLVAERDALGGTEINGVGGEIDEAGGSIGPPYAGTLRYSNMRAQLDALKDELDKVELQRDDQQARADAFEREFALLKLRNEELQIAAAEAETLKDEVDALKETAARVANLEDTVANFKKHMDELSNLRKQVKQFEKKEIEHVQVAYEHEQALKRINKLRGQLHIYEKQVTDLNEKLDAQITKANNMEIENRKINTKLDSLQRERDAMVQERVALRETVDELRCSTITTGAAVNNVSKELMPNDMKIRLIRLEHENKMLRENEGAQADQASVQALLEDYAARLEKQRGLNREANQRIMQLEATLETVQSDPPHPRLASALEDSQRKSLQLEELQSALAEERRRTNKLQEQLSQKDADLLATEDKYKKCVEKAKEVIKTLDPRTTGQHSLSDVTLYGRGVVGASASGVGSGDGSGAGSGAGSGTGSAAGSVPRADATGSPQPAMAGQGWGDAGSMRTAEERLMTAAWYRLGARCHRDAVEQRFALLSAGHSFLARQRRAHPRQRTTIATASATATTNAQ